MMFLCCEKLLRSSFPLLSAAAAKKKNLAQTINDWISSIAYGIQIAGHTMGFVPATPALKICIVPAVLLLPCTAMSIAHHDIATTVTGFLR